MKTFVPDPANYTMKGNSQVKQVIDMPVTRNLSDDDLRTMAREKLSSLLQSIDPRTAPSLLLSVAREVMDRIEGKPTQRIEQKIEHSGKLGSSELTNDQLIAALRHADVAGLLPAGVKLLDSGDVITDADYVEVKAGDSLTS